MREIQKEAGMKETLVPFKWWMDGQGMRVWALGTRPNHEALGTGRGTPRTYKDTISVCSRLLGNTHKCTPAV